MSVDNPTPQPEFNWDAFFDDSWRVTDVDWDDVQYKAVIERGIAKVRVVYMQPEDDSPWYDIDVRNCPELEFLEAFFYEEEWYPRGFPRVLASLYEYLKGRYLVDRKREQESRLDSNEKTKMEKESALEQLKKLGVRVAGSLETKEHDDFISKLNSETISTRQRRKLSRAGVSVPTEGEENQ